MARKKHKYSTARRWHRSIGIGAALFALFMISSGLVLNHSNGLGLDQRHVSQPLLLSWYGLKGPETMQSFAVGEQWLSFAGGQLYLDGKHVAVTSNGTGNGVGATTSGDWLVAASTDELLLFQPDGVLIDRFRWDQFEAGPIDAIGQSGDDMVIIKSSGFTWQTDKQLLDWRKLEGVMAWQAWSVAGTAPEKVRKDILAQYRGNGPSLEKLVLDAHSGRLFGTAGMIIYDLMALALGFLALSGLVLWVRGRRNGRRKS